MPFNWLVNQHQWMNSIIIIIVWENQKFINCIESVMSRVSQHSTFNMHKISSPFDQFIVSLFQLEFHIVFLLQFGVSCFMSHEWKCGSSFIVHHSLLLFYKIFTLWTLEKHAPMQNVSSTIHEISIQQNHKIWKRETIFIKHSKARK